MGCGLLRELKLLKKITWGGLYDGSGCADLFGAKTHGVDAGMRDCPQPTKQDAILQAPCASGRIELLTVVHAGTLALAILDRYTSWERRSSHV